MNREEVCKLLAIFVAEYGDRCMVTAERVELWLMILGYATYEEAATAVQQVIGEAREFPPVVGQINQRIIKNKTATLQLDWPSQWILVERAAANSSYNAENEAVKLPALTLQAAGGIAGLKEIALLNASQMPTVRAQFRQRFEDLMVRKAELEQKGYMEGSMSKTIDGSRNGLIEN